ncbi:unnamed protein product [Strongylus vulgaris]|uniref:Tyr recombinase domain-containing protein n=1 Tax=Strongylus vulgaris TaxID=40348 RepID=A0A3P7K9A7_STRVU|nr:unnamed protein product [Strongylus vulgaris]
MAKRAKPRREAQSVELRNDRLETPSSIRGLLRAPSYIADSSPPQNPVICLRVFLYCRKARFHCAYAYYYRVRFIGFSEIVKIDPPQRTWHARLKALGEAGLGSQRLIPHSFRGGAATSALKEGSDSHRVMLADRWKSSSSFRAYVDTLPI